MGVSGSVAVVDGGGCQTRGGRDAGPGGRCRGLHLVPGPHEGPAWRSWSSAHLAQQLADRDEVVAVPAGAAGAERAAIWVIRPSLGSPGGRQSDCRPTCSTVPTVAITRPARVGVGRQEGDRQWQGRPLQRHEGGLLVLPVPVEAVPLCGEDRLIRPHSREGPLDGRSDLRHHPVALGLPETWPPRSAARMTRNRARDDPSQPPAVPYRCRPPPPTRILSPGHNRLLSLGH